PRRSRPVIVIAPGEPETPAVPCRTSGEAHDSVTPIIVARIVQRFVPLAITPDSRSPASRISRSDETFRHNFNRDWGKPRTLKRPFRTLCRFELFCQALVRLIMAPLPVGHRTLRLRARSRLGNLCRPGPVGLSWSFPYPLTPKELAYL